MFKICGRGDFLENLPVKLLVKIRMNLKIVSAAVLISDIGVSS